MKKLLSSERLITAASYYALVAILAGTVIYSSIFKTENPQTGCLGFIILFSVIVIAIDFRKRLPLALALIIELIIGVTMGVLLLYSFNIAISDTFGVVVFTIPSIVTDAVSRYARENDLKVI